MKEEQGAPHRLDVKVEEVAAAVSVMRTGGDRASLLCANPRCSFAVHENPTFGNFCCKKCHWCVMSQSRTKNRHGQQCAQRSLPENAERAAEVPPDRPCDWGGGGGATVRPTLHTLPPMPELLALPVPVAKEELAEEDRPRRSALPAPVPKDEIAEAGGLSRRPADARGRSLLGSVAQEGGAATSSRSPRGSVAKDGQAAARSRSPRGSAAKEAIVAAIGKSARSGTAAKEPLPPGIRLLRSAELRGESYGSTSYKLYEGPPSATPTGPTVLFVWMHGADNSDIPASDLLRIGERMRHHTHFLVPMSPKVSPDGYRFNWGLRFTKAQNKDGLGFIYGEMHEPYLNDLCDLVRSVREEVCAERVCVCGYSMGGFGVYQVIAHDPEAFDVAVPIAGYVQGTMASDGNYAASQPEAAQRFHAFLKAYARQMASVPLILAVHARCDRESSFADADVIVKEIHSRGGKATLHGVPDDAADSDPGKKRKPSNGHRYFKYTLLGDTSETVLYQHLRQAFAAAPGSRRIIAPRSLDRKAATPGSPRCHDHRASVSHVDKEARVVEAHKRHEETAKPRAEVGARLRLRELSASSSRSSKRRRLLVVSRNDSRERSRSRARKRSESRSPTPRGQASCRDLPPPSRCSTSCSAPPELAPARPRPSTARDTAVMPPSGNATSTGHPRCTTGNVCIGVPDSRLFRHLLNGESRDLYCEACWSCHKKQHPQLEGREETCGGYAPQAERDRSVAPADRSRRRELGM